MSDQEFYTNLLENLQLELSEDEEGHHSWEISQNSIDNAVEVIMEYKGGE